MHILLIVLKILGILILAVFLTVLVLALLLMLVPFRYQLQASHLKNAQTSASFRLTWLFRLAEAAVSYQDKKLKIRIRLACFTLWKKGMDEEPEHIKEPESKKEQEIRKNPGLSDEPELCDKPGLPEKPGHRKKAEPGEESEYGEKPETRFRMERRNTPDLQQEAEKDFQDREEETGSSLLSDAVRFLCALPGKLAEWIGLPLELVNLLTDKGDAAEEKLEKFRKKAEPFLDDEMKDLYRKIFDRLRKLAGHYFPRRIKGFLHFGTGMPDLTGKMTGFLYLLLPAGADQYELQPEFTETVFETDTQASGHIRVCHMVLLAVSLFSDRRFRKLIHLIRKQRKND